MGAETWTGLFGVFVISVLGICCLLAYEPPKSPDEDKEEYYDGD